MNNLLFLMDVSTAVDATEAAQSSGFDVFGLSLANPITAVIVYVVVILLFMYVLSIRPHKKVETAVEEMRKIVQIGDPVLLATGFFGKVVDITAECFIVEIDKNKNVRAKKTISGNLRFYRKNIAVTAGEMENILNRELADLSDNSVVDIILTGAVSAEEYEDKNKIIDNALSRFVEGTYNDYALSKLISKELIESEFPETSFSAGLLTSLLDEPKEAQLAYELLKSLKEGK